MKPRRALQLLRDGLQGKPPAEAAWTELLEAANQALVTPRLRQALAAGGQAASVPAEVAAFFELIDARNDERNLKLRSMALQAVEALNATGVVPIYLKGMAAWASSSPDEARYPRMMSDVDLLVGPQEADRAIDALLAGGFKLLNRHLPGQHVVAEFWREGDVGVLDLHQRPPGPQALADLFDREAHTVAARWPGQARLPSPAYQLYLICLHDMLHDGGFWRGGFDVRHLCDIADLTRGPGTIDWSGLKSLLGTRLVRNAAFSQLVAAHRIAGAQIPPGVRGGIVGRLHYQRHRAQYLHPKLGFALALLGIGLEGPNLRQYWPFLGAEGMTPSQLLWWLGHKRRYPNKI